MSDPVAATPPTASAPSAENLCEKCGCRMFLEHERYRGYCDTCVCASATPREEGPPGFHFTEPRRCVECEKCGFAFDATHTDEPTGTSYSCPVCEHVEYVDCATIALDNLRARAERAEAERDALVVGIRRVLDCPCLSGASCDELDTLRATLAGGGQ